MTDDEKRVRLRASKRKYRVANPEKSREHKRKWRAANPEKVKEQHRKYYVENLEKVTKNRREYREKASENQIKRKYGLSREQYETMYEAQSGKCAICSTPRWSQFNLEPEITGADRLHIDHDHTTGEVRGLLCTHCNRALGSIKDNIATAISIGIYLENFYKR